MVNSNYTQTLPHEVVNIIFSYLNPRDLALVGLVSKSFFVIANQKDLWINLVIKNNIKVEPDENVKIKLIKYYEDFNTLFKKLYTGKPTCINQYDQYLSNIKQVSPEISKALIDVQNGDSTEKKTARKTLTLVYHPDKVRQLSNENDEAFKIRINTCKEQFQAFSAFYTEHRDKQ